MGKAALHVDEDIAGAVSGDIGTHSDALVAERTSGGAIEVILQPLLQPAAGIVDGIAFPAMQEVAEESVLDSILGKGGITPSCQETRIAKHGRGIELVHFEDFAVEIDLIRGGDMQPLPGRSRVEAGGVVEGIGNTGS